MVRAEMRKRGAVAAVALAVVATRLSWSGSVLIGRGEIDVRFFGQTGAVVHSQRVLTDTVVGSRGDDAAILIGMMGQQALDVIHPVLRRTGAVAAQTVG